MFFAHEVSYTKRIFACILYSLFSVFIINILWTDQITRINRVTWTWASLIKFVRNLSGITKINTHTNSEIRIELREKHSNSKQQITILYHYNFLQIRLKLGVRILFAYLRNSDKDNEFGKKQYSRLSTNILLTKSRFYVRVIIEEPTSFIDWSSSKSIA